MKPIHFLTAAGFLGVALPTFAAADPFHMDQIIRDILIQNTARHIAGDDDDRRPHFYRYDDRHKARHFSRDDDDDDDRRWGRDRDDDDD